MSLTSTGSNPKAVILHHDADGFTESFQCAGLTQTITFDADLITGNKVNMKIKGLPISEITFATSNDATMAALAAAIAAMPGVASATVTNNTTHDHAIVITPTDQINGIAITDITVTAGSTQAGFTVTTQQVIIQKGTPVELNSDGKVVPVVSTSDYDLKCIGYSLTDIPDYALKNLSGNMVTGVNMPIYGTVTVACRGEMKIRCVASGAITPGPVIWAGLDADGVNKVTQSGTPSVTNMYGWAVASAADTGEVNVILK